MSDSYSLKTYSVPIPASVALIFIALQNNDNIIKEKLQRFFPTQTRHENKYALSVWHLLPKIDEL